MTINSYHWIVITKKALAAKLFDWEKTSPGVVRRRLEVAGDELKLPPEVTVGHHARLLPQPHLPPHPRDSKPISSRHGVG